MKWYELWDWRTRLESYTCSIVLISVPLWLVFGRLAWISYGTPDHWPWLAMVLGYAVVICLTIPVLWVMENLVCSIHSP